MGDRSWVGMHRGGLVRLVYAAASNLDLRKRPRHFVCRVV